MKINKITVNNLFGVFNHSISINNDIGITIIIGENGLGKTVMLEMIEAFFKGRYLYFSNVSFDEMIFEFEDKVKWVLTKEINNVESPRLSLSQVNKNGKRFKSIELYEYEPEQLELIARRIGRSYNHLSRIHPKYWEDRRTGEKLSAEELVYNYSNHSIHSKYQLQLGFSNEEKPKWFTDKFEIINVSLIETQRLISLNQKDENNQERTVERYAKDLSRTIKKYLTESTELSSKLDRTYPNRLIDRLKNSTNITKEFLNEELKRLEAKRETLDVAGLIEIEKDSNLLAIENPGNEIIDVLMLYVEDSFEKIKIFDTLSRKIEILLDIINKRFKHKKLVIDKEEGFLFKSTILKNNEDEPQIISVNQLSSGEQNELVLFYILLFKTKKNSLILIDEPEVSLHISWQNSFIEDLKEITKLNNLDILIATHSPDIIANNWNLKVELKGLE
ncbi:AAA family ATPase [Tenacibaculum sp.]|uniref:AAA family ATPase n=1 Tax=Tenacibaculum sp. TaxID=1906242 RepID=UPI003AA8A2BF